MATIVALMLLRRTPLRDLAYVVVMVGVSAAVAGLGLPGVLRTGSQHSIRAGLPNFTWPTWSVLPSLLVPALSLTIIGLSFGAGVAQDFPNAGGTPARPSRDFVGQGMANLVSAFFQCLPSAGSMSRTAYLVETGARTRWAGAISGLTCLGLAGDHRRPGGASSAGGGGRAPGRPGSLGDRPRLPSAGVAGELGGTHGDGGHPGAEHRGLAPDGDPPRRAAEPGGVRLVFLRGRGDDAGRRWGGSVPRGVLPCPLRARPGHRAPRSRHGLLRGHGGAGRISGTGGARWYLPRWC